MPRENTQTPNIGTFQYCVHMPCTQEGRNISEMAEYFAQLSKMLSSLQDGHLVSTELARVRTLLNRAQSYHASLTEMNYDTKNQTLKLTVDFPSAKSLIAFLDKGWGGI